MAILVCKIKKHIFLWLEGLKITFKFKLSWQKSKVFCRAVVVAQLGTAVTSLSEVGSSNPLMTKIYLEHLLKRQKYINKEAGNGPFYHNMASLIFFKSKTIHNI